MYESSNQPTAAEISNSSGLVIRRRDGSITEFKISKIEHAIKAAFLDVEGAAASGSERVAKVAAELAQQAMNGSIRSLRPGQPVAIEMIQDQVELALMRSDFHKVAREYVLYRERHAQARQRQASMARHETDAGDEPGIRVSLATGESVAARSIYEKAILDACTDLDNVSLETLAEQVEANIFDGISEDQVAEAQTLCARQMIEREPNYTYVAARLLLSQARMEALRFLGTDISGYRSGEIVDTQDMVSIYPAYFRDYVKAGVEAEMLDPRIENFDLDKLGKALDAERDLKFTYLGLQSFYDRYLLHIGGTVFETPQALFMRVAMGLALNEAPDEAEDRAIEFYEVLSSFDFMSSTPTLFNAGTTRPQLSSCYLTNVGDDLGQIYGAIKDNAMLSKFAGGLGNDWTPVRSLGSHIKGTNGKSQGVVPFLKVANDTAVAVNQGGRRKGAVCAYLETWHLDIEEFLDLRKNTGDDRRRTHDMNTANWIPDLFIQRVLDQAEWTLFSPNDVLDLHDLYGAEFEAAYVAYEAKVQSGEIKHAKTVEAVKLWRKMLSMVFETGHPWLTFKDPCNLRSPQQHRGVVHSSNLCTEITLNTRADDEIAVCNLGSINLPRHMRTGSDNDEATLDVDRIRKTVKTAMRMLDNVIDINHYSVATARQANLRHRPVGLGIMGFQDALYQMRVGYDSQDAVNFADESMEAISFAAIEASSDLARERGAYESFEGSLWSQGVLPIDSIAQLQAARRASELDMDTTSPYGLDWGRLRQKVKTDGMRNSNCMAIAPTATIANITGVSQSIEPTYQNLYVKSNLSGEFTVVNPYLAADLKRLGLWDEVMVNDLKYHDGSVQLIDRIPDELKAIYKSSFEIAPDWLIDAASKRQKWIDQAQSLNLYMREPSGRKIESMYLYAWRKGLKTTYYLRTMGATHTEKSTLEDRRLNQVAQQQAPKACSILEPDCEACS